MCFANVRLAASVTGDIGLLQEPAIHKYTSAEQVSHLPQLASGCNELYGAVCCRPDVGLSPLECSAGYYLVVYKSFLDGEADITRPLCYNVCVGTMSSVSVTQPSPAWTV